ncbi:hypothetical protein [Streptomyces cacaoi]
MARPSAVEQPGTALVDDPQRPVSEGHLARPSSFAPAVAER